MVCEMYSPYHAVKRVNRSDSPGPSTSNRLSGRRQVLRATENLPSPSVRPMTVSKPHENSPGPITLPPIEELLQSSSTDPTSTAVRIKIIKCHAPFPQLRNEYNYLRNPKLSTITHSNQKPETNHKTSLRIKTQNHIMFFRETFVIWKISIILTAIATHRLLKTEDIHWTS